MTIKDLFFDLFGIQYYDLRIYSQRQQIRRLIVRNYGQNEIKVKKIGIFVIPKDYKQILRRGKSIQIFADTLNSELCDMDVNEGNEKIIEKQYDFKNYYNIIHKTIAPDVLKELFENKGVKDTLSQPIGLWEQYGTIIIAGIIIIVVILLFTGFM